VFPESYNPLIGKLLALFKVAYIGCTAILETAKRPKTANIGKISLSGNILRKKPEIYPALTNF
jgi:hypothetical protein